MVTLPTISEIRELLQQVKDPEIPTISLIELGVIDDINIDAAGKIQVTLIPTFSGCPAINWMQSDTMLTLKNAGYENVEVMVDSTRSWSSDRITEKGRQHLMDFGLSPPPLQTGQSLENDLMGATCPNCRSQNTELKSPFGPTLCRAIHYCNDCHETFEQFKPL